MCGQITSSAFLKILIMICIFLPSSMGFTFQAIACTAHKECKSCVNSNIGPRNSSCFWCLQDNKCYSVAGTDNPCSSLERIINERKCEDIRYDPLLAYKMVLLSGLAYAGDVEKYIAKRSEVNSFRLIKQVTKPCSGRANFSGFTALSHKEKAIAIAFRGTETDMQLVDEFLKVISEPKVLFKAGGKVQAYFSDAFHLIWNDLNTEVYKLVTKYTTYNVWVTGHSLGGAIASLASTLIAYDGKVVKSALRLYTFGQPRVGNFEYASAHDNLVPVSFRLTHYRDPVVHLPMCEKRGLEPECSTDGPYHHGKEIFYASEIMSRDSSYKSCNGLPHNEDIGCSENIFLYGPCLIPTQIERCIKDHLMYFEIDVAHWWKNYTGSESGESERPF